MAEKGNFDFIYDPIKEKMRELVTPITFATYIEKLTPVDVDGRFIVLETPTETFAKYITGTLAEKMREAIIKADVGVTDFRLKVEGSDGFAYNAPTEEFAAPPQNLNAKYTFESFVPGNNDFVYEAALSVANDPAGTYNPLFLYGGTGLGKTHLIQAIANKIIADKPILKVIYVTCEQFVNEIIDTMFTGRGPESREKGQKLRQYYRGADVLIIDDIQFIEGKKAVQEEFFHTFNELVSKGKQIVISSDHPPKELTQLEERIRTRFAQGLVFDMVPPSFETKLAILRRKSFEKKVCVPPDDVLEFLAKDSGDDVRTLEGRLTKVIFASKLHEKPITIELAKSALSEAVSETGKEEITPQSVISAVTGYFRISKNDLLGKSKKKEIVIPRQICCYLMCELLTLPLVSIGKVLGGRDHTTILYSRDKVEEMCRVNEKIAKDVDDIKNIILKK